MGTAMLKADMKVAELLLFPGLDDVKIIGCAVEHLPHKSFLCLILDGKNVPEGSSEVLAYYEQRLDPAKPEKITTISLHSAGKE